MLTLGHRPSPCLTGSARATRWDALQPYSTRPRGQWSGSRAVMHREAGTPTNGQARGFSTHLEDRPPRQQCQRKKPETLMLLFPRSIRRTVSQGPARSRANPNQTRTKCRILQLNPDVLDPEAADAGVGTTTITATTAEEAVVEAASSAVDNSAAVADAPAAGPVASRSPSH